MQVAVVSILLMVGACGAPADSDAADQASAQVTVRQAGHFQADSENADPGSYESQANFEGRNIDRRYFGGHYVDDHRFPRVVFPWYSPVWLMHGNAEFYPGNYARPYDFREKFNYPWNGPRPGGYAQFGPGHFAPPGIEDTRFGSPHLEPIPPGGDTSTRSGPDLRPARSIAATPSQPIR